MSQKSWTVSRRAVLRGVGAMVALPALDSLWGNRSAEADPTGLTRGGKPPVRMAVLYMANGVNEQAWTPKGAGKEFELSPTLSPLAKLKDDILVFTELMNAGSMPGDGHYVKTAGFLTGTTIT